MLKLESLLSPWIILFSIIIGAICGLTEPQLAIKLAPFGELYLKFLQMLVLPMLITAVVSGLGNLFISGMTKNNIIKILWFLFTGLMIASLVGIIIGLITEPGANLPHTAQVTLGKTIIANENNNSDNKQVNAGLFSFVEAMIPSNIFTALNKGDNLAILFFSILVGVSMGLINTNSSRLALEIVNSFFEVFLNIIGWLMYLLPFGLLCLFAGQIAEVGIEIIGATAKLIFYIYIASIILMLIYSGIIWWQKRTTHSYLTSLTAIKKPLFVALGTSSSLATIPVALNTLKNNLQINKNVCDLIIPLGFTINPPGVVLHFSIASIFMAQIYGIELGVNEISIIFIGSILAGLAASSAPGVVGLSMIAMILDPLGLPTHVAIILLLAIDPIVDPILTALNVHANCAMTVFADDTSKQITTNKDTNI